MRFFLTSATTFLRIILVHLLYRTGRVNAMRARRVIFINQTLMSDKTATQILGSEKIGKLLFQYALPSIIAMTAASLYNVADSIFIGHGVGALAISALAITLPLMNLAAAFGAMVGIGASSLLSIKLGQRDHKSALQILGNTVMLNTILGIAFSVACFMFLAPILYSFGASEATIDYAREYMSILLWGNIFTHLYMGLNNVLRAAGYPRKSMMIMIIAVASNCLMDWVFIFIFGWGIAGAAWATVLAQVLATILEVAHFSNKKHDLHFQKGIYALRAKIIKGILSIGMAPFLMNLCASLVVIFINNALLRTGGDLYVGAYGIINRVIMVALMIVFGLNQGMQPIVGYNYGAKKFDRVKKTLKLVMMWAVGVTTCGFLAAMFFPEVLVRIFTTEAELTAISARALRIAMSAFVVVGFQVVSSSFFQSIGKAHKAIFLSLTRQMIFLLPLLIILPGIYGSDGVWMSMPIADGASSILAMLILAHQFRMFRKEELAAKTK